MERLRAALDRAEAGTASATLVSGDAGVGKSRLLAEIGAEATERGAVVLTGRCLDVGETGLPYLPFVEMLTQVQRFDPAAVWSRPALGRLLPEYHENARPDAREASTVSPPPERVNPQPERDLAQLQFFDAMLALIGELAAANLVLLLVEDVHWAESSTRDLLSFLLSRLRHQRVLVVVTYRADDLHRRHPLRPLLAELVRLPVVERIDLGPFGAADARAFVAALAEEPMPDGVLQQIAERSEGNAFFAEELVAASIDHDGVPTALADVLLSRIEKLSPEAQHVVRIASVAGRRVWHARLQAVAEAVGLDLDGALREAVQHHILLVDEHTGRYASRRALLRDAASADVLPDERVDVYLFRHALLREAVYADLLPGERVRLHAAYAKLIAKEGDSRGSAAALAHHSFASHDLPVALTASVRAAEETKSLGAPAEALRHVELALRLWDAVEPSERPDGLTESSLLREASYLAGTAGEPERAVAFARSAVKHDDAEADPEGAAESYRRLSQALTVLDGGHEESVAAIERAWQLVRTRPISRTRAWVLAVRAANTRRSSPDEARADVSIAIHDARELGFRGAEADALTTMALLDEYAGDRESAVEHLTNAVETAQRADSINTELRARYFLAMHSYDLGHLAEAVRRADAGVDRARLNGLTASTYGLELRVLQSTARYACGDWDGSAEAAETPDPPVSDTVRGRLAAIGLFTAVGRGRFEETARLLAELRPFWGREAEIALAGGNVGAELALWQGDPALAVARAVEALDFAAQRGTGWPLAGLRLLSWALAGQAELVRRARREKDAPGVEAGLAEADALLARAVETGRRGRPWNGRLGPEGRAWLAVATAERSRSEGPGDPDRWRSAVAAFEYGEVYPRALARLRLAEAMLGADDREGATEQLRLAAETADRLGAGPLTAAVGGLARRGRITVPGVAPVRAEVDPFTPRERAVLTLVAAGCTNREVGEQLFISEKTVSVHLSRIMAKLGAARRAEAVATAYDRGLLEPPV